MREQEILSTALENLKRVIVSNNFWVNEIEKESGDGQILITLGVTRLRLNVEVKKELRAIHLLGIYEAAKANHPFILVTERISPNVKEELRKNGINYLEANGNIHLKDLGSLLFIDSNSALPIKKEQINRAFTKIGLKVVFQFLLDESLLNAPYREIAARSGIALGNVNYVLNGLKEKGYLIKKDKNQYQLLNKKELLETWVQKYEEKLKPELLIGNFRFLNATMIDDWKGMKLLPGKTFWGAEPAGNLLTGYLRPAVLTFYTQEPKAELIKKYRLVPDPKGNVILCKQFWEQDQQDSTTVPPLLVYADLINTNDQRCIETAQKIYDGFLKG